MTDYFVHETAVIDAGAVIGTGSSVWHFCHLMPKAVLGAKCSLGQNVFVANNVILGDNVKVQNNVSIYEGVSCEKDVFLGPSMVFTNVNNPRSAVNRKGEYDKTVLRQGVTVGANATIVCGVTLGAFAFVGAGAVVTSNVPAYAQVVGNPAKQTAWRCEMGNKMAFDAQNLYTCTASGNRYKLGKDANNQPYVERLA